MPEVDTEAKAAMVCVSSSAPMAAGPSSSRSEIAGMRVSHAEMPMPEAK